MNVAIFLGFQPHFHVVTDKIRQDSEILKMQYLSSLSFDLFEMLHVVRT